MKNDYTIKKENIVLVNRGFKVGILKILFGV